MWNWRCHMALQRAICTVGSLGRSRRERQLMPRLSDIPFKPTTTGQAAVPENRGRNWQTDWNYWSVWEKADTVALSRKIIFDWQENRGRSAQACPKSLSQLQIISKVELQVCCPVFGPASPGGADVVLRTDWRIMSFGCQFSFSKHGGFL